MAEKKIIFSLEVFREKDQFWKYHYDLDSDGEQEINDTNYLIVLLESIKTEMIEKDFKKNNHGWDPIS